MLQDRWKPVQIVKSCSGGIGRMNSLVLRVYHFREHKSQDLVYQCKDQMRAIHSR